MAIKTFTDNTSLPASDINTYLTNSGLVYVTTTSFNGAGFSVNTCFTSLYENYRIQINGYSTADSDLNFRFRIGGADAATAVYQYASQGYYGGVRNDASGIGQTSIAFTPSLGAFRPSSYVIEVWTPNTTNTIKTTNANGSFAHSAVGVIVRNVAGLIQDSRQFDGFSIISAATIVGTATVYGYRKA